MSKPVKDELEKKPGNPMVVAMLGVLLMGNLVGTGVVAFKVMHAPKAEAHAVAAQVSGVHRRRHKDTKRAGVGARQIGHREIGRRREIRGTLSAPLSDRICYSRTCFSSGKIS